MLTDFNKNLFFDNISYLIKKQDLKVGEIENSVGVSTGYISRSSKDEKSKPSIEFVMKVAELLHTNVDTLLRANFANITPTEEYLIGFFNKLISDTNEDKLHWIRETKYDLEHIEVDECCCIQHPLFEWVKRDINGETGNIPVFISHNSGNLTEINGNCYHLRLKNGVFIYVMNIIDILDGDVIEIWMNKTVGGNEFICDNKGETALSNLITSLYTSITENISHPKIDKDIRYVIDAFMNNDLEDDKTQETEEVIPF